jgi:hypothetical protein
MRVSRLWGVGLGLLLLGLAGPAFAQGGGDISEEVKKAVERSVGASVSSSVAESLSRSIVSEGLRVEPKTTFFFNPFYNRTEGDFDFGSFDADTGGGVVGMLFKLNNFTLLHAALSGAHTSVDASAGGLSVESTSHLIDGRLGASFVVLNTQPAKAWLTLEGGISQFDAEDVNDIWSWRASPSATLSLRGGPILFEPTIGFSFSRPFSGVEGDKDTTITFNPGFALKYRGEVFRPQLNFLYSKIIHPGSVADNDDGVISVGPEILFAVTPNILVGGAYNYSTPLTKDVDVNSHTVTLEFRWIF